MTTGKMTSSTSSWSRTYIVGTDGSTTIVCRLGHDHSGEYAETDAIRCECPHDAPLWSIAERHFICAACGKDFYLDSPMRSMTRWRQIIEYLKVLYR